jgi:hypothetical protein
MEGKKKFEIKFKKVGDKVLKAIFINDVMLDYSVDVEALKKISALGSEYKKAALLDIEKHFIECVCDMVGRQVTAQELEKAFRTGWI